ncbi:fatty acid hydroxylase superfamily-domain-containing protein [Phlyctochytrium arcticum]|nr:fatty acid hydroxylase superfamily-domain-containing protein [Phlyctochytrium arcticum]
MDMCTMNNSTHHGSDWLLPLHPNCLDQNDDPLLQQPSIPYLKPWLLLLVNAYHALPTLEPSEKAMIVVPVACYWIYSSLLFILSALQLTSLELHRIPTDQNLRPKNRITVSCVLRKVAIQHLIQCAFAYTVALVGRPAPNEPFPSIEPWPLLLLKLFLGAIFMDTYQYWMHRWMHTNRFLYRHFHSVHHQLTVLYAFGALYNHPLEGFLMDTIGGGVPSLLLNMHPWTSTLFYSLATLKTVDDHCGYALPWDPFQRLFRNNAEYHDIHHWGKGRMYNFSQPFFTFWDVWMGTDYERAMRTKAKLKSSPSPPPSLSLSLSPSPETPIKSQSISRPPYTSPHSHHQRPNWNISLG